MLTAEQAAAIEARQSTKAAILAEGRTARVEQYKEQYSHIGIELVRSIPEQDARLRVYGSLALTANYLFAEGCEGAGRVLASIARGIVRGTVMYWGKEDAQALQDTPLDEPEVEYPYTFPEVTGYVPVVDGNGDTQLPLPTPDEVSSLGLSAEQAMAFDELDLTMGLDREDTPGALEPMQSPEPDASAAERGRQRRAAKQAERAAAKVDNK